MFDVFLNMLLNKLLSLLLLSLSSFTVAIYIFQQFSSSNLLIYLSDGVLPTGFQVFFTYGVTMLYNRIEGPYGKITWRKDFYF